MRRILAICLSICLLAFFLERTAARQKPDADWPSFNRDPARPGTTSSSTGINASNLSSLRRQQVRLNGTVDSSPIYLQGITVKGQSHDVFFVTTTYGKTIALDANDGSVLWEYTPSGYQSWAGSYRITNAAPVADPDRASIYSASPDGYIQKLVIADGRVQWRTAITKLPQREKITSSLNFFNGRVIATTGGYIGDQPPYQGHVVVLDASNGRVSHVWNALCSDRTEIMDPKSCGESGAAIWGRAGAVVDTTTGNMFVATGNAKWDGRTNWGDAVIELDRDGKMVGNYTPQNTEQLNEEDGDLGSTSPALLDGRFVAQGGKDGRIRVLNVEKIRGVAPHRGGEAQELPMPSASPRARMFGAPAVVRTASATWLFASDDNGGTAGWQFSNGRLERKWKVDHGGTSPVVAGDLLYVYDPKGALVVLEPQTGRQLAKLDCGPGHWNSPVVTDGRIALPEGSANDHNTNGVLNIWRIAR